MLWMLAIRDARDTRANSTSKRPLFSCAALDGWSSRSRDDSRPGTLQAPQRGRRTLALPCGDGIDTVHHRGRHSFCRGSDRPLCGRRLGASWGKTCHTTGMREDHRQGFPSNGSFLMAIHSGPFPRRSLCRLYSNSRFADCGIPGHTAELLRKRMQELIVANDADRLGLLFRIMAQMASAPEREREMLSTRAFSLDTGPECQHAMSEAVRYLLANFRDEIRLEDVLDLTHMSKATFSRQFKKHSGKSFSDFLSQIRLQSACRELIENNRSILDIALSSGFSQVTFFNRLFRRTQHCSPSQYRLREQKRQQQ